MFENLPWGRGLRIGSVMALTLLLAGAVAWGYRFAVKLVNARTQEALDQQRAAMKGYLRIEDGVYWYYDDRDPDATQVVRRLQRVFFLADQNGRVIGGVAGGAPDSTGEHLKQVPGSFRTPLALPALP